MSLPECNQFGHVECLSFGGPFRVFDAATGRSLRRNAIHSLIRAFIFGDTEVAARHIADYVVRDNLGAPVPRSLLQRLVA